MSDTLNLNNNSQAQILLAMSHEGLLDSPNGTNGFQLCKKYKISYAVWNENYKILESKLLIVPDLINTVSKIKKKNSQRTKRPSYPYILTELGLISLSRYVVKNKRIGSRYKKKTINIQDITKFIPSIEVNWNKLCSLYQSEKFKDLLLVILEYAFNQLQFYQIGTGKESFVRETITIHPEVRSSDSFNLERFYHGHYYKIGKNKGVNIMGLTTNLHEVEEHIELNVMPIDRLAFLFYYNLLRLTRDDSFQLQVLQIMNNAFQTTIKKQEIQKLMKKSDPFRKMLQRKERYLIALIHKDKHLKAIFHSCLNEINEKIVSKSLFQNMSDDFLMSKTA